MDDEDLSDLIPVNSKVREEVLESARGVFEKTKGEKDASRYKIVVEALEHYSCCPEISANSANGKIGKDNWISVAEAAKIIGKDERTIRYWASKFKVAAFKKGRDWSIYRQDIENMMKPRIERSK